MDLTTQYLGMTLRTPLVPSSSPLATDIDNIKRMEDAGAAAVVLQSLFEEQLMLQRYEERYLLTYGSDNYPEALTYFPGDPQFWMGPEAYLSHIQRAKGVTKLPIIASLNGSSLGEWTEFARKIEQAGADALELNVYYIPTSFDLTAADVEQTYLDILQAVKKEVSIPVAIKLGPYFSSMANMAKRLDDAGADALVLFNRFYQPEIDLNNGEVRRSVILSTPQALRLPLTWISILHGRIRADLAATGGVHTAEDALKLLIAGANVTMLCSVLLAKGIEVISTIEQDLRRWMEEHEHESVQQIQGSMSQRDVENPSAFERAQYMLALKTHRPPGRHGA